MLSLTGMNIQTSSKPTLTSNWMELINACWCMLLHDSWLTGLFHILSIERRIFRGPVQLSVSTRSSMFPMSFLFWNTYLLCWQQKLWTYSFSNWIPRAHQRKVSSFTHKAVVNPKNEPIWIGHFAWFESDILHEGSYVQVFLCSSTPLRRVVGEYWRSCSSLELSDSNYISPSPAVFGRPFDYLLDRPDQSGVSGSIHSPTAIHRNGTLSWWICQYPQWHQHPRKNKLTDKQLQ